MKELPFARADYLLSALTPEEFPTVKLSNGQLAPEIAIVGRSNAGKSSFLNALFQSKSVAKTSSTPGKTQRINFFLADEALLLVDLPGYGYAKAPKESVADWSQAIDHYLHTRSTLQILLLVLDLRREPSAEDLAIATWAGSKEIALYALFTKQDKLSDSEAEKQIRANLACIESQRPAGWMALSNEKFHERRRFIRWVNEKIKWD